MHTSYSNWRIFLVWFLSSIFYAYQYILRVLPNIMMPEILEKFQVNAEIFGQFSGLYYVGYSIMHCWSKVKMSGLER
jgi:sugar phosphate permease